MKKQSTKIKLSFSGAIMIVALFLTHSYLSLAALIAASLHEIGHIVAAKALKVDLYELRLGIFGASLSSSPMLCSYKKEIILCLAGPLVNLISALAVFIFFSPLRDGMELFMNASLFLGFLNLLPIYEFDGGRILNSILSLHFSVKTANRITRISSFILIFILWSLSVYLLLRLSSTVSLFIFSISLFSKIFLSQESNYC